MKKSFVPPAALWLSLLFLWPAVLPAAEPAESAIRAGVERYFKSWSEQDLRTYQACFHPDAIVFYKAGDGSLVRLMLEPFIESQRLAHANSSTPMREIPTKIEILTAKNFASALVHWELTKPGGVTRGVDVFTWVLRDGEWKIASLVFGDED